MNAARLTNVALLSAIAFALTACGASTPNAAPLPGNPQARSGFSSPIQHVVIVVRENRSFNDFFATTTQGSDSFTAHQDLIAGATVVKPGEATTCISTVSVLSRARPRS
jgi:phospholipase C